MALSRSRALCSLMAGEEKGRRTGNTLAISSATNSVITDSGNLLVSSGFGVGDYIEILASNNNTAASRRAATAVAAGSMTVSGAFAATESANAGLIIRAFKRACFAELAHDSQLELWSSTQPTTADDAENGTLLVTFTGIRMGNRVWDSTNKEAYVTLYSTVSATAVATGTAGWFRWRLGGVTTTGADSSGAYPRLDGTVGVGTGDFRISNAYITLGDPQSLSSAKMRFVQAITG